MLIIKERAALPPLVQTVLDRIPCAIAVFDMDGRAVFLNEPFKRLHEIDKDWIADGRTLIDRAEAGDFGEWHENPRIYFDRLRGTLLRDGEYSGEIEMGGRIIRIDDIVIGPGLLLTIQQDVTDKVRSARLSDRLTHFDQLTGMPNRASLRHALNEAMACAQVRNEQFSLLVVDVDRFKDVNDLYGDAGGDAVLKALAQRFEGLLGPKDLAARLGGDEFAFICQEGAEPEAAANLATRLLEAARLPIDDHGRSMAVTVSIGAAIYPEDGDSCCELIKNAQTALSRAKHEASGEMRIFSPEVDRAVQARRRLLQDLRQAIGADQLELHYQPQASVDGKITGFEALLRWRHPERGLVAPDVFIPLAEETNLILPIGEWVLRTACKEAASWPSNLQMAVNISPVQIRSTDLPHLVDEVLKQTGLDPGRLELEITEGVLINNAARASDVLCRLKTMGVAIAMDDFGTGYSSLSYLQAFPFDKLKIDKSFVRGMAKVRQSNEIVRAIVGLGAGLGIPVLAEGVESGEELDRLRSMGCALVQGYLIGRPAPAAEYLHVTGIPAAWDANAPDRRERHICSGAWIAGHSPVAGDRSGRN